MAKELEINKSLEFAAWFRLYLVGQIEQVSVDTETADVVALRRGFRDWGAAKDGLKQGCKNDELFIYSS